MKRIDSLHTFDQLKVLADPRRLELVRILMASPNSLTELALRMKQSAPWVYHHIQILESAKLVERYEVERPGKRNKKFYRGRSDAFLLRDVILPKANIATAVISGSQDPALEQVAETLSDDVNLLYLPGNSLDGMANLRSGYCQVSGSDLLDVNNEYDTSFVRHLFPEGDVEVITFAHRIQGLMIAHGNPHRIMQLSDLAEPQLRFVSRDPGSGSRLWLDAEMQNHHITLSTINGYQKTVKSEFEAATLIGTGKADVAIGLQATARQHGLDFIPLFEERYDLILRRKNKQLLQLLLDYLQTSKFRAQINTLNGYSSTHSGEQVPLNGDC